MLITLLQIYTELCISWDIKYIVKWTRGIFPPCFTQIRPAIKEWPANLVHTSIFKSTEYEGCTRIIRGFFPVVLGSLSRVPG